MSGPSIFKDHDSYEKAIHSLGEIFRTDDGDLNKIRHLASSIKKTFEHISPFMQEATREVCPRCPDVCCISKHGYYTQEDLVYLFALGLKPPQMIFGKNDPDPCQFLLKTGCCMDRWLRPSGCTWYFCDSLLDYMELQPAYREFDEMLREVAELWIEMTEEFRKIQE
jgi:hypothetical protein